MPIRFGGTMRKMILLKNKIKQQKKQVMFQPIGRFIYRYRCRRERKYCLLPTFHNWNVPEKKGPYVRTFLGNNAWYVH